MLTRLRRWMYRGDRPNRAASIVNGIWRLVGRSGLLRQRLSTLEVRGRRSGRSIAFPVVVAEYGGDRDLVSMLGERVNWVANVRAASGHAILHHGQQEPVVLEEVPVEARAPILQRYLEVAPGARSHIPVDRHAPLAAFEGIAPRYPVFRVRSAPV